MALELEDRLYGKEEVSEPVFLDLISTKEMQRLKSIAQYGVPSKFYHFDGYSRYEHSLGVFILLRRLNASREEQIAGLVHDISHTALSHVIDWVFNSERDEDYQDKVHHDFIVNSEIKEIIEKYHYNVDRISNTKNFSLLEQEIPTLCVDRIDYCLRDDLFDKKRIPHIVQSITIHDNKVVFSSFRTAKIFGENYMKCQIEHWGGNQAIVRYKLFSDALKIAMREKIITEADLFKDDNHIINKLLSSNTKEIINTLNLLTKKLEILEDKENPELELRKKFRYINPSFIEEGKIYSMLDRDEDYAKLIDKHRQMNEEGVKLRILGR